MERFRIAESPIHCSLKHIPAIETLVKELMEKVIHEKELDEKEKEKILHDLAVVAEIVRNAHDTLISRFSGVVFDKPEQLDEAIRTVASVVYALRLARAIEMRLVENGWMKPYAEYRESVGDFWACEKHLLDALIIFLIEKYGVEPCLAELIRQAEKSVALTTQE